MPSLRDTLLTETNRPALVEDCAAMIEAEVQSKSGIRGVAIKTAFKTVKKVKPTIIGDVCDGLVDKFVDQLEPINSDYLDSGSTDIAGYVNQRAQDVADALLQITDRQAEKSPNRILVKAYGALRPQGKKLVVAARPRVGRMLAKHGV